MDQDTVRRREAERLRHAVAAGVKNGAPPPQSAHGEQATPRDVPARDPELQALVVNVRSLWNVGAIFRTADGAGIGRLVLSGITGTPPRPEIAKTALGAEDAVPWIYDADPEAAARRIKSAGFRLLVLETGPGSRPLAEIDPRGPLCLVVGHELAGVSPGLLALADELAALPMRGVKESLNVAVAFGIAAYHLAAAREALRTPGGPERLALHEVARPQQSVPHRVDG
jgi:tRNA G18 (ribose-2'-O)-methylase SpoU